MRTQVIPAQITTVEDKIAGNLNLTQIMLLITPVLMGTAIYALLPPSMSFVVYKLVTVLIIFLVCLTLAIRVQGKVLVNWLAVVIKYASRPKYYVFDKNDMAQRDQILLELSKKQADLSKSASKTHKPANIRIGIPDLVRWEETLGKGKLGMAFKTARKGGLNVVFNKVAKES